MIRRYVIHPPQLVGRLSQARQGDTVIQAVQRTVGEYDSAMQELQRFLKYLMDANDTAQVGAGIDGVLAGAIAASGVSFAPAGRIASTNVQTAIEELDAETPTFGEVMSKVSLGF